jgi:hypothetical protein
VSQVSFFQAHRETDRFLVASGFQLAETNFHFHRTTFSSQIKSKIGNILTKAAVRRIVLNIDRTPIDSTSHTHPSHSQTSRLLTSSLSLGVPVPRNPVSVSRVDPSALAFWSFLIESHRHSYIRILFISPFISLNKKKTENSMVLL